MSSRDAYATLRYPMVGSHERVLLGGLVAALAGAWGCALVTDFSGYHLTAASSAGGAPSSASGVGGGADASATSDASSSGVGGGSGGCGAGAGIVNPRKIESGKATIEVDQMRATSAGDAILMTGAWQADALAYGGENLPALACSGNNCNSFVAALDPVLDKPLFVVAAGASVAPGIRAIEIGNQYLVAGTYQLSGPPTLNGVSPPEVDGFVALLSKMGMYSQAKAIGKKGVIVRIRDVAPAPMDSFVVAGDFQDAMGQAQVMISLFGTQISSDVSGNPTPFVAHVGLNMVADWVVKSDSGIGTANAVGVAGDGTAYVAGFAASMLGFGGQNVHASKEYLLTVSPMGNMLHVASLGDFTMNAPPPRFATTPAGDVVLAVTLANTDLMSPNFIGSLAGRLLVAKMGFPIQWINADAGIAGDYFTDVSASDKSVFVTGTFEQPRSFYQWSIGPGPVLVTYDASNGMAVNAVTLGDKPSAHATAVTSICDRPIVGGDFVPGPLQIGGQTLQNTGPGVDIFISSP
jgi:hypothetical protein